MGEYRKIINDPVYGFITIDDPLLFDIISHPYYQRLRRIHQMALAFLVYPGAVHTRLMHSLGAYHLMCTAVNELRHKGTDISKAEELAVKAAILLHDIGHGPFSHALEGILLKDHSHEDISLNIMKFLNRQFHGSLDLCIDIFTDQYPRHFLHQLISGQIDVDRMDYLTRDCFFTGVTEGVIGYDRILKMLKVYDDELMVEEKGIYSIEKFLIARRQMYWQVYLHKTVLGAEKILVNILKRVRELACQHLDESLKTGTSLDFFLFEYQNSMDEKVLDRFCMMDDMDVTVALKHWEHHQDFVLSDLSRRLLNRDLFKIRLQSDPFEEEMVEDLLKNTMIKLALGEDMARYYVFTGEAHNTLYKIDDDSINIYFKDGSVRDISEVDNPLISQTVSAPVKKFYICSLK